MIDNSSINPEWETEEEKRLQMELEDIMTEVGEDGFTMRDKAILRSNLPIPKEYGSYPISLNARKKFIAIKYDSENQIFVVDEDRE